MVPHLAAALAVLTLVADPYPPVATPPPAATLAYDLGHLLGSAAACGMFDHDRLDAAAAKAKRLIRQTAEEQDADDLEANDRYREGMEDGRDAVRSDDANCSDVEAGLLGLESRQSAGGSMPP